MKFRKDFKRDCQTRIRHLQNAGALPCQILAALAVLLQEYHAKATEFGLVDDDIARARQELLPSLTMLRERVVLSAGRFGAGEEAVLDAFRRLDPLTDRREISRTLLEGFLPDGIDQRDSVQRLRWRGLLEEHGEDETLKLTPTGMQFAFASNRRAI
jgi:hypothetical protein